LAAAAACAPALAPAAGAGSGPPEAGTPIVLGSRRELLVDDFLIANSSGTELRLHKPVPREVAIVCDAPWEGNISAYYSLFQDGSRYRMYYRGQHYDEARHREAHPAVTCYAESRDGLVWEKPRLGLFEFQGSRENNIVWAGEGTHNFTPFADANPHGSPQARYKALAGGTTRLKGKPVPCLFAFGSADGLRWSRIADEAVITAGAFDSQNLAFWDSLRGEYRAYWRIFADGVRAIRTATSKDFLHWEHQADVKYESSPVEHLYTNTVRPYFRAPQLLIGFPTRFQPKTQQVEPVFMSSRDGLTFRRWSEALVPITAPQDRAGNRSNYMTWGLLELPGHDRELSVYATEAYYQGPGSRVRRFTFRVDGFVSAHAGSGGGSLTTRPITFRGRKLLLNIATAASGCGRAELQDASGRPIPGFTRDDCRPITGDHVEHAVSWKGGDLGPLAGRPVRLGLELEDADLYAFQFR
jgi:hypothetical protein